MIATIAEKKKFSDRSDHMETGLYFSLLLSCPFPSKLVYKFGFRSSVQKNGLPGKGRHIVRMLCNSADGHMRALVTCAPTSDFPRQH